MPRSITDIAIVRDTPTVTVDDPISAALEILATTKLPAVPVLKADGRYHGIFGEREFIAALFPGYLDQMTSMRFLTHTLDETIDRRAGCIAESVGSHANTEHVEVDVDAGDAQLAEVFLHHRVLLVPVLEHGHVVGVVTRSAFFRELAARVVDRAS
ncbi:CBS domain-containing protein [Conexibacter sp. W3-3-2]|uniref:CBS domain-containing protein n=1 Tax=Solirubrobacterales TaxID=588673 RepID=UPI0011B24064|nr:MULTISPECIES: CBS domain-containing protein [Solirubrobacterales]MTD44972.1 CBS domain-containing protein [Conexibacter sp. W3-3-2]